MRCDHEPKRFEPDGNDHVGLAIPILVDVPLPELPLGGFIRKQGRLHILRVELNLVWRLLQASHDRLIHPINTG